METGLRGMLCVALLLLYGRAASGQIGPSGGTQHAEDAVHVSGDIGTLLLAVRNDSAMALSDDGDNTPLSVNDEGRLVIAIDPEAIEDLDDMNTSMESAAASLDIIEADLIANPNAVHGNDAVAAGPQLFAEFDDTTPSAVTEGQSGRLRISANRNLMTTIRDVTNERGLIITPGGAALMDYSFVNGVALLAGAGATGTGSPRVTIANDDDVSDAATLFEANLVAHDAVDAGSPLKLGLKATNTLVGNTPVANADRTDAFGGLDGVLIFRPHSNLEDRVSGRVANTDGAATSLVAAQGAGVRFCATTLVVSNSSATNVTVDLTDGSGGTALVTIPAAANMGGGVVPLQTPLCTTANTALFMDGSAAATTVTVTAVGFKTEL